MAGRSTKKDALEYPEREIVRLYWMGLTIKQLTKKVASSERTTIGAARGKVGKVEKAVYESVRDLLRKK